MGGQEIMNSRAHGSGDALAERACERIAGRSKPRILVGGLGLGFTAAAALQRIGPGGRVVMVELVSAVVRWNRGPRGPLADHPLRDPRVTVLEGDIVRVLQTEQRAFDAILLDVDNGLEDLIRKGNDRLYTCTGLETIRRAQRPGGVLAVWSAGPYQAFAQRLRRAGFQVNEYRVRDRVPEGGRLHTIWLGVVPDRGRPFPPPAPRRPK
jgi:spermidine synthase